MDSMHHDDHKTCVKDKIGQWILYRDKRAQIVRCTLLGTRKISKIELQYEGVKSRFWIDCIELKDVTCENGEKLFTEEECHCINMTGYCN